tara:strand:- start:441 stop:836 length:396 start_codon:yes stop_codon:yes gene_type:complete
MKEITKDLKIQQDIILYKITTIDDFKKYYIKSNSIINVLIFSATWCGPCKRMKPIINQEIITIKQLKLSKIIKFFYIDIDNCLSISEHFKISTLPTIIIEQNNQHLHRLFYNDASKLTQLIKEINLNINHL